MYLNWKSALWRSPGDSRLVFRSLSPLRTHLPLQARSLCSSEWPHVLKLFLCRLQPLAQTLDVFIVWLVLLLVHFQQRSQDFDAMLFLRHTFGVFKLAYNRTVACCFVRFTGVNICVGLNVVLGVGEKLSGLPSLLVMDNSFRVSHCIRCIYVLLAHVKPNFTMTCFAHGIIVFQSA